MPIAVAQIKCFLSSRRNTDRDGRLAIIAAFLYAYTYAAAHAAAAGTISSRNESLLAQLLKSV